MLHYDVHIVSELHRSYRFWSDAGVYTFSDRGLTKITRQGLEDYLDEHTLACSCTQESFERGLWRFMSDEYIWRIAIAFPKEVFLLISKVPGKRGELHVCVTDKKLTAAAADLM